MKRKLILVVLIVALGVFLTAVLGITRGWYREKIGTVGISGWDQPGWFRVRCSVFIDIYSTQKTDDPEEKRVKIFVHAISGEHYSTQDRVDFDTSMSPEEWEDFISYINSIDKRLHECWGEY